MPTLERERTDIIRPLDRSGRHLFRAQIDKRAVTTQEDGSIGFAGHAIVFNTPTWIGSKRWGFWEQIAPEAVTKTIQEADVRFLINHDPNLLLARNKSGTLRLTSDAQGLAVDADIAPTTYGQDLAISLDRGDISQMSFAFEELGYAYSEINDGEPLYTVTELRLFDVSVVTYPAYEETDAGLRALAFEEICRTTGINASESRKLMRSITSGDTIPADLAEKIRGFGAPKIDNGPDTSTRDEHSEPAAPTRTEDPTRELRLATLAAATTLRGKR